MVCECATEPSSVDPNSSLTCPLQTHIIGTSGIDNTPGARRTVKYTEEDGSSQPILLEEELVYYRHTKNKLEMYWKGVSGPITFPYKPHDANFESYVEGFTVTSIASGTATLITHFVNYTTKTPVPAYHFAASDQTQATAALAKKLGAQLFAGAFPFNGCPGMFSSLP